MFMGSRYTGIHFVTGDAQTSACDDIYPNCALARIGYNHPQFLSTGVMSVPIVLGAFIYE
jgi:hypothetical protein